MQLPATPLSMYRVSVPIFLQYLTSLTHLLDLAEQYASAQNMDPAVLLSTRLHPTMYNFGQQVREALRHALIACELLADVVPPAFADQEPDFAELRRRIDTCSNVIASIQPGDIDGTEGKEIAFRFRSGAKREFSGAEYLLTFCLPQFFFHVTTAYDILRHMGVPLAKKDFLGGRLPKQGGRDR